MIGGLGIAPPVLVGLSWLNLLVAGLLLFPATFFTGNLLNAAVILLLIAYALRAGNLHTALVEVPFLLLPLALIWLKHSLAMQPPAGRKPNLFPLLIFLSATHAAPVPAGYAEVALSPIPYEHSQNSPCNRR